ncbi:probable ribosome biogenesis protein RLP24 [Dendronephthya gigantea]|uniref:probable ribosome biogenesis protein RLP24 n=1 Tax=Dendronephthya gigantea TaxID=151771 RepID=UPI00106D8CBD|nr:probable ribosome biogenesis protein RLP24 [Dendronephthya gigantea]XP_028416947.1 probable ribosome biogenesis protein RLP24 [Dendronephthya gigantea]
MRLEKCYFCSSTVWPGHGIAFVRNDCKVFRFCRAKCHKAFKRKRNPRKVRWTKAFRKAAGKELAVDSTFDFEKKRDVPVRYTNENVRQTVTAMKRISEIQEKRQKQFIRNRLKASKKLSDEADLKEVETNINLIKPKPALKKSASQKISQVMKDVEQMETED